MFRPPGPVLLVIIPAYPNTFLMDLPRLAPAGLLTVGHGGPLPRFLFFPVPPEYAHDLISIGTGPGLPLLTRTAAWTTSPKMRQSRLFPNHYGTCLPMDCPYPRFWDRFHETPSVPGYLVAPSMVCSSCPFPGGLWKGAHSSHMFAPRFESWKINYLIYMHKSYKFPR